MNKYNYSNFLSFLITFSAIICTEKHSYSSEVLTIKTHTLPEKEIRLTAEHLITSQSKNHSEYIILGFCDPDATSKTEDLFPIHVYAVTYAQSDKKRENAVIESLKVYEKIRRKGIGKLLFEKLLKHLQEKNYKKVFVGFDREVKDSGLYSYDPDIEFLTNKLVERGFKIYSIPHHPKFWLIHSFDNKFAKNINSKQIIPRSIEDEDPLPTKKGFWQKLLGK